MAAWLGEAVHREMRAAARDVCKSGGACRASAWASSLTNMEVSCLLGVKLASQPLMEVTLHAKHPSHIWEVIWMPLALAALKFASNWVKPSWTVGGVGDISGPSWFNTEHVENKNFDYTSSTRKFLADKWWGDGGNTG